MNYIFGSKSLKSVKEMLEHIEKLDNEIIFCGRCHGKTLNPFGKIKIDNDELVFCDSECLSSWLDEYHKKSEAKINADNDFDFFIINSIAANQY